MTAAASALRDAQRARVYRAEDAWAARLDAARQGAALATVGGSALLLPAEKRFGTLDTAAAYAARVLALPEVVDAVGEVAPPALRTRRGVTAAHWEPPGTIALPVPVHGEPWALRECVLLHELAHHAGGVTGRSRGHRPPFPALVLLLVEAALGAEAAFALRVSYGEHAVDTGVIGMTAAAAGDERLVDRIGKLLAQAEGTDNEHEAAAFVERAQQLATAHSVDLERARVRQRERQQRGADEPLVQERLDVGPKGRRGNRHRVLLFSVVARVNDVLVNVAHDSSYVLGFGHRADLEVVERLWLSLAVQMTAAAQRRLDAGEHRQAGVAAQTWRLSFYDGYVDEVGRRLTAARERAVAAAAPPAPEPGRSGEPSAALVLRAKAERVQEYYTGASQARGSWRGPWSGRTAVSGRAQDAGRTDARRADLGQPGVRQRGRLTG